ncbi:MAG: dephospho-CoA kinase, long form [Actinobacteria bacterium]|nr:dephospho-CoA kinase, long form [Actinomycetota bacterium]
MHLVGLTGGLASGKSTVASMFADRGAVVIDADAIAREVVAPGTPGFEQVVERFGDEVVGPDGSLERDRLAAIVFDDGSARADLNAIVHPKVGQRIAELVAEHADSDRVVVVDVPLLVEVQADRGYRDVVVVTAPEELRVERVVARGMDEGDARARIAAQASDAERREVATHVIDNSGDLDQLEAQVDHVWEDLQAAAAAEDG